MKRKTIEVLVTILFWMAMGAVFLCCLAINAFAIFCIRYGKVLLDNGDIFPGSFIFVISVLYLVVFDTYLIRYFFGDGSEK